MNKKAIVIAIVLWGIIIFGCLFNSIFKVSKAITSIISNSQTEVPLDKERRQEISKAIGIEPSWVAFRDYIYCKSLHKGMTREEVEKVLSRIGEIRVTDYQIEFTDLITNTRLGPVVLVFENDKLLRWRRSPYENFGQTLAECERDQ